MDARSKTEFAAQKRFYNSWPGDLAGIPSFGGVNKISINEKPTRQEREKWHPQV